MIPEVYVDKEIMPLLLKAKYPVRKVIKQDFRPVYYTKDFNDEGWQECEAYYIPTQAQVMKWLREVHNLFVFPFPQMNTNKFWTEIYQLSDNQEWENLYYESIDLQDYSTYEEACEAAIKYYLENLIINL